MAGAAFMTAAVTESRGDSLMQLLLWGAVLIGVVILIGAVVLVIRRYATGGARRADDNEAIRQLESLHRRGALSDEEFDRARRSILGLGPSASRPAAPVGSPDGPDESAPAELDEDEDNGTNGTTSQK